MSKLIKASEIHSAITAAISSDTKMQQVVNGIMSNIFDKSKGCAEYQCDEYDGTIPQTFPEQVGEVFAEIHKLKTTTGKGAEAAKKKLAKLRVELGRWEHMPEGLQFTWRTGTKKEQTKYMIGLKENTKQASTSKSGGKGKEKGKSGTEVKATIDSVMTASDMDVQDVLIALSNREGASIASVVAECKIFIADAAKK